MSKNLFTLTAVLLTALFAGCQPDPTLVHSTQHQAEKPKAPAEHSSTNANGSVVSQAHNTSHREPMNTSDGNHSAMNHSGMNHSTMQSAPNAAAQPYDLQFLDTMIAHHEGALEMAKPVASKSENAELKTFAAKIIADQQKEIAQMKAWREQWFAGKPSALNMEMPGMTASMKGMNMPQLNALSGKEFSNEFLNQMIAHHDGAVVMAREALTRAEHTEIKTLANQIVQAQEAEIAQMRNWRTQSVK